jgi:hypothetical protein
LLHEGVPKSKKQIIWSIHQLLLMFRWENAIALHKPWEIMDIMKGDTKVERTYFEKQDNGVNPKIKHHQNHNKWVMVGIYKPSSSGVLLGLPHLTLGQICQSER